MNAPRVWIGDNDTVYVQWGERGAYRWLAETGATGERFTPPNDAREVRARVVFAEDIGEVA